MFELKNILLCIWCCLSLTTATPPRDEKAINGEDLNGYIEPIDTQFRATSGGFQAVYDGCITTDLSCMAVTEFGTTVASFVIYIPAPLEMLLKWFRFTVARVPTECVTTGDYDLQSMIADKGGSYPLNSQSLLTNYNITVNFLTSAIRVDFSGMSCVAIAEFRDFTFVENTYTKPDWGDLTTTSAPPITVTGTGQFVSTTTDGGGFAVSTSGVFVPTPTLMGTQTPSPTLMPVVTSPQNGDGGTTAAAVDEDVSSLFEDPLFLALAAALCILLLLMCLLFIVLFVYCRGDKRKNRRHGVAANSSSSTQTDSVPMSGGVSSTSSPPSDAALYFPSHRSHRSHRASLRAPLAYGGAPTSRPVVAGVAPSQARHYTQLSERTPEKTSYHNGYPSLLRVKKRDNNEPEEYGELHLRSGVSRGATRQVSRSGSRSRLHATHATSSEMRRAGVVRGSSRPGIHITSLTEYDRVRPLPNHQ